MHRTFREPTPGSQSPADPVVVSDIDSLRRIDLGERRGLEELVHRYAPIAQAVVGSLLDPTSTQAVTREIFSDVWRGCEVYDPAEGSVRTWLIGLIHRRAVDRARNEKEQRGGPGRGLRAPSGSFLTGGTTSAAGVMRSALQRLPSRQRQVVELMYFCGLSKDEVSRELGMLPDSVGACCVAAMHSLAEELGTSVGLEPRSLSQADE